MHLNGFGEADHFTGKPLDACAERQVFPFNCLRMALARLVLSRIYMSRVRTPVIGIEARDAKWLQQRFELQKHLILATPKDISQHLATPVINRMPQPPLASFAPNK